MVFAPQGHFDSQSAAIESIAPKIGCGPDTLRAWVRRAETDSGRRDGVTTAERDRIKALKWVDWFNNRRLLEPVGYITPTEAEEAFYANLNTLARIIHEARFSGCEWRFPTSVISWSHVLLSPAFSLRAGRVFGSFSGWCFQGWRGAMVGVMPGVAARARRTVDG